MRVICFDECPEEREPTPIKREHRRMDHALYPRCACPQSRLITVPLGGPLWCRLPVTATDSAPSWSTSILHCGCSLPFFTSVGVGARISALSLQSTALAWSSYLQNAPCRLCPTPKAAFLAGLILIKGLAFLGRIVYPSANRGPLQKCERHT